MPDIMLQFILNYCHIQYRIVKLSTRKHYQTKISMKKRSGDANTARWLY